MSARRIDGRLSPEDVTRLRSGDRQFFDECCMGTRRDLEAYAARYFDSADEREDYVQDVFVRAWSRRETFQGSGTIAGWLWAIAGSVLKNAIRQRARDRQHLSALPEQVVVGALWQSQDPGTDESSEEREQVLALYQERLELARTKLSPLLVEAWELMEVQGLPSEEAAKVMGCTPETARKRRQRARRAMAEAMGEDPRLG